MVEMWKEKDHILRRRNRTSRRRRFLVLPKQRNGSQNYHTHRERVRDKSVREANNRRLACAYNVRIKQREIRGRTEAELACAHWDIFSDILVKKYCCVFDLRLYFGFFHIFFKKYVGCHFNFYW